MTTQWTVGVEQEFLLVDPRSRHPVALAAEVSRAAASEPPFDVQRELTPYQIEIASGICETPEQLAEQVCGGRKLLAEAAVAAGCRLVAVGLPPIGEAGPPPGTDDRRYHLIEYSHRRLVTGQGVCGLHVHVGVPDRATAIQVSNALRPWLPIILALSANSPLHQGSDTGYASWRAMLWSRWPVSGPPPRFDSPAHYDRTVEALVTSGALIDPAMVYWDIRPSAHLPTVEVRVADIPLLAREVIVLAELIRALAVTAASSRGEPVEDAVLRASYWRSARDGVDGLSADPYDGRLGPAYDRVRALVEHVTPALRERGQLSTVERHVEWLRRNGSGAARQRRTRNVESLVDMLIAKTSEGV